MGKYVALGMKNNGRYAWEIGNTPEEAMRNFYRRIGTLPFYIFTLQEMKRAENRYLKCLKKIHEHKDYIKRGIECVV